MGEPGEVVLVATLGRSGPPNGQVLKARAVQDLLANAGPLRTIQPGSTRGWWVDLVRVVRRGKTLCIVLNRRGLFVVLGISGVVRRLSRRKSQIVVVVVGGWMPRLVGRRWYARVIRAADDLLVESARLESELSSLGPTVTRFPNFRDLPLDPSLERAPLAQTVKLCCAGRVRRDKGVVQAAELTRALRERGLDATLDILGPVEHEDVLEVVRTVKGCTYLGEYDPTAVVEVLAAYDFLVLASSYEGECQPGSVVEGCFAGLPAVVSDWQDLPEMVEDGVSGYVIPLDRFAEVAASRIEGCVADGSLPVLSRGALDRASELTTGAARQIFERVIRSAT